MAQVNITLQQEEVLQILSGNRDDALRFLIERILNEIMKAESEEQLGAGRYERIEGRTDSRNGTRERRDEIIRDYETVAGRAVEILDSGFEDSMTILCLPGYIRVLLRSTNIIEMLNRELKRRSDVIGVFPNSASVMRLMGAVTMEYSDAQSAKHKMFTEEKLTEIQGKVFEEFRRIAERQVGLLKAA